MKSALLKDIFRELRQTRSRFISIMLMVALASMFLCGLRSAAPDMQLTADGYYDRQKLMDFRVVSTLGLVDDDVQALAALDGVACAEGSWSLDAQLPTDSSDLLVKVHALSSQVNVPVVTAGRLPEAADECAVEQRVLDRLKIQLGDTVTLTGGDELADQLHGLQYTVTGVVESPYYIGLNRGTSTLGDGEVDAWMVLPRSAFTMDYYTEIYLRLEGADALLCYGEEYAALRDRMKAEIDPLAEQQVALRHDDIVSQAEEKIAEAEADLNDGETQLADQEREGRAQLADARRELDDGWQEYNDSLAAFQQQIAEGEQKLADAAAKLESGRNELSQSEQLIHANREALLAKEDEAENALLAAEQELAAQKQQLDSGEAQYQQGLSEYNAGSAQLDAAVEQLTALRQQQAALAAIGQSSPQLDAAILQLENTVSQAQPALAEAETALEQTRAQLDEGQAQYQAAAQALASKRTETEQQLADAWAQIQQAEDQLAQGRQTLETSQAEYDQGKQELESSRADGQKQLDEALAKLSDGEAGYTEGTDKLNAEVAEARDKLDDGWLELGDARADLAGIEKGKLYLLDRTSLPNYVGYQQDSERMDALGDVFPVLFFVVAALVCLTTMTRMVEEQRTQIGVLKAIGYGTWSAAQKFLIYGCLAASIGTVLGCIIGTYLLPWIICTCYSIMYTLSAPQLPWHWGTCAGVAAASLGSTLLAVLWAVWASIGSTPAALMLPKAPKAGKRILLERIGPLWRRMSFSMKVSARNLLRYQKRFWMTVIGVGGCTALIIAGFGLREGILSVIDRQFGVIYAFDLQVTLSDTAAQARRDEAIDWLCTSGEVESAAVAHFSTVTFSGEKRSEEGYLVAAENSDAFLKQYVVRDYHTKELLTLPDEGCIVTEKLAELLNLSVGDEIVIDNGQRISVPVAAVSEQYVHHYVFFSAKAYEAAFGETAPRDTVFTTLKQQDDASRVTAQLLEMPAVAAVSNLNAAGESFRDSMSVVNYAVFIIIISAAALAFVVLYNLTNINITERMRELATLKVLGFFDGELAMYVYRENIVLTVLGIALGQLIGRFLSTYLVRTVEIDMVMFGRYATWTSYAWSIGLSLLFALLVNVAMFYRLRRIDMIESLKSVE